jgi:hypothetical protein
MTILLPDVLDPLARFVKALERLDGPIRRVYRKN